MTKKALPLLTGGLNEITRADLIDDSQLQVCTNYEIVGDGVLRKRKGITAHDASGAINELSSIERIFEPYYPQKLLEGQTNDYLLFVYANNELHAFYYDGSSWVNTFDESTLNDILRADGVIYTGESDVQLAIGSDKVIIADGVNPVHFVSIDKDGNLRAGKMGIPAPTNKATVTEMTEWQSDLWETDSTASRLSAPGLFQCVYTVVTKYGEESNPSPLSNTLDMQFFKLDADGIDERWLEKVEIKDLSLPDVSQNVLDDLKYFKVYMRVIRYSEGEGTSQLEFTEQFEIANKTDATSGSTGNDYTLTVEVSPGDIASYENDVAPIAKTVAQVGGITMAGNIKTKIAFPWDFKYYHKITINNKDSKTYVDAVIRVRFLDSEIDNLSTDDFFADTFINGGHFRIFDEDMTTPLALCHMTDIDLYIKIPLLTAASPKTIYLCWNDVSTTPITVVNGIQIDNSGAGYEDGSYPLRFTGGGGSGAVGTVVVSGGEVTEAVLSDGGSGYTSAPNVILDEDPVEITSPVEGLTIDSSGAGYEDGSYPLHFTGGGGSGAVGTGLVRGGHLVAVVLSDGGSGYTSAPNVSLDAPNGEGARITATIGEVQIAEEATFTASLLTTTEDVPTSLIPADYRNFNYGEVFKIGTDTWSEQQVWSGRKLNSRNPVMCDFDIGYINRFDANDEAVRTDVERVSSVAKIPTIDQTTGGYSLCLTAVTGEVTFAPPAYVNTLFPDKGIVSFFFKVGTLASGDNEVMRTGTMVFNINAGSGVAWTGIDIGTSVNYESSDDGFFVALSWDRDSEKRSIFIYSVEDGTISSSEGTDVVAPSEDTVFESLILQAQSGAHYDNVSFAHGRYYSAENADDNAAVQNMANLMPAFDNMIGYDYSTHNNNIDFDETKEIEYKDYKNMVKWTDVNYQSFPDLFYKQVKEPIIRIMPAPSFLQFEYRNTFIIFTRNGINRFVLEGSADGWSGSSSSLIEEKTQYGLLAPESLVRAGDALFWLSEVGVIMWNRDGLQLISKNIVDVPIKDSLQGFYAPLKNQYIIHDNSDSDTTSSYVYHIDRNAWTKFTGLDIVSATTMTGGSELDNVNLLLETGGGISKYPSNSYTSDQSEIETKEFYIGKGVLRKMKVDYGEVESGIMESVMTTENLFGQEKENTNTIDDPKPDHWRGIALKNSRGKRMKFKLTDMEEIRSIMYDVKLEE